jgi:hypothetical protein
MVILVTTGVVLGAVGIYEPFAKFAGAGATVPLTGFGNVLWKGVKEAVDQYGFLGIFMGGTCHLERTGDCRRGKTVLERDSLGRRGLSVRGYAAWNRRCTAYGVPVASGRRNRDCDVPAGTRADDCEKGVQTSINVSLAYNVDKLVVGVKLEFKYVRYVPDSI